MKNVLLALTVVITVVLGVSVGAQAGPSADTVSVDVEVIPLLLSIVEEAPEKAVEHIVWDWDAQLCYVRAGYAAQPPPETLYVRGFWNGPDYYRFAELETLRPTERVADGRRFRGDWPRGRLIREA